MSKIRLVNTSTKRGKNLLLSDEIDLDQKADDDDHQAIPPGQRAQHLEAHQGTDTDPQNDALAQREIEVIQEEFISIEGHPQKISDQTQDTAHREK